MLCGGEGGGNAEGEGLLRRPCVSRPRHRHRLRLAHFLSACLPKVKVRAFTGARGEGEGGYGDDGQARAMPLAPPAP